MSTDPVAWSTYSSILHHLTKLKLKKLRKTKKFWFFSQSSKSDKSQIVSLIQIWRHFLLHLWKLSEKFMLNYSAQNLFFNEKHFFLFEKCAGVAENKCVWVSMCVCVCVCGCEYKSECRRMWVWVRVCVWVWMCVYMCGWLHNVCMHDKEQVSAFVDKCVCVKT